MEISNDAILKIVEEYTREGGLRNLEREIAAICRKVARKVAEGKTGKTRVTCNNIHTFLGPPRFLREMEQEHDEIGVATGLAWTSVGGEILQVEASLSKGRGNLTLTGQLGDVMKESAQAAVSYARSHAKKLGLEENFYQKQDIHIHVPAGSIPKDGPSAGITMGTALISALTRRPVNRGIAMTGEITLRGHVLPVGGLKEKCLAAFRSGVNTVAIPYQNEKDLDEIPRPLRNKLHFVLARNMSDVLAAALDEKRVARRSKKSEQNPETKTKKLGNQNPTRPKKRRPERNVPLTG
jgi:ATP-dependent Lon protease